MRILTSFIVVCLIGCAGVSSKMVDQGSGEKKATPRPSGQEHHLALAVVAVQQAHFDLADQMPNLTDHRFRSSLPQSPSCDVEYSDGPVPLTEAEFAEWQRQLKNDANTVVLPSVESRRVVVNVCNKDRCVQDSGDIIGVENGFTEVMTGAFLGSATFSDSHVTIEFHGESYTGILQRIDRKNDVAIYRIEADLLHDSEPPSGPTPLTAHQLIDQHEQRIAEIEAEHTAEINRLKEKNRELAELRSETASVAEEELSRAAHEIELLRQAVAIAEAEAVGPPSVGAQSVAPPPVAPDTATPADPKADAARIENGRSESTEAASAEPLPLITIEFAQAVAENLAQGVGKVASENPEAIVATVYKYAGCIPCRWMEEKNGPGNSLVAFVYTDGPAPAIPVLRGHRWVMEVPESRPLTTWYDAQGTLRYAFGPLSTEDVWKLIQRNDPPTAESLKGQNASYAASGYGGTIHGMSAWFDRAVTLWEERIGVQKPDGSPVKVNGVWRRTGGQTYPLIHRKPEQWKVANVFGSLGEFEFSAEGSKLPVSPMLLGYRRSNGRLLLRGEIAINEEDVGLPGDQHTAGLVAGRDQDPSGFGPMTLLTIVTVVRDLFAILNPTCDLTLGGTVSGTAWFDQKRQAFVIDLQDMPAIKLVMLWQFDLGVKQLVWSRENLHVEFTGSRWIRSRDFKGD